MTATERFTRWGQAFENRDRQAWDLETAPEISITPVPGWPDQGPFIGRDAAWRFLVGTEDAFDEVLYDGATELEARDGVVFTCVKRRMRPKGAADLVEVYLFMVADLSDEGVTRIRSFLDREEAVAAAGFM